MTSSAAFVRPDPPWLHVSADPGAVHVVTSRVAAAGAQVLHLRGVRMRTDQGVFTEFATGLDFPDYFGHNWPALQDCLTDLAWLPAPGYLLVVEAAEHVLAEATAARVGLLGDVLTHAGRWWGTPVAQGEAWDRPAAPFHVVLRPSAPTLLDPVVLRWAEAGVELHRF